MERYFLNIPLIAFKRFLISNILIFIHKLAVNLLTSSLYFVYSSIFNSLALNDIRIFRKIT